MAESIYGNLNTGTFGMDQKHRITDANADTRKLTSQHTGSECVRNRSPRSVLVCLVVLCVLLLTAVIVLCVLIYTNNPQFHINNKNITEERDQLLTKYTNITEERDQLLTKYTNITEERDQLLTKYTNITEERDQLLTKNGNLIDERDQLLLRNKNLTIENNGLLSNNNALNTQNGQLTQQINRLQRILNETDGWIYYNSSFYYISSVKKRWSESRRYCTQRGADLTIINNKEEQEFVVKATSDTGVWIGLSDGDVEGRWKWVDNSTLTSGFWKSGQDTGHRKEKCAVSYSLGWYNYACTSAYKWMCERSIFV